MNVTSEIKDDSEESNKESKYLCEKKEKIQKK